MAKHACHKKRLRVQPYRWLGAGVITVGLGAAALTGPAVAYADDTSSGSASVSSKPSRQAADEDRTASSTRPPDSGTDSGSQDDSAADNAADHAGNDSETSDVPETSDDNRSTSAASEDDATFDTDASSQVDIDALVAVEPTQGNSEAVPADREAPSSPQAATSPSETDVPSDAEADVAQTASASTTVSITSADVPSTPPPTAPARPNPLGDLLVAFFRRVQSTLFNESPTAAPVQYAGQSPLGVVTGIVGATDPDGDPLVVTLQGGPLNGSVIVNPDGTYTYTPAKALALTGGSDTFTVYIAETNAGSHIHGFQGLWSAIVRVLTFGTVRLDDGSTITQTVTVSIAKVNFAPTAGPPTIDTVDDETGTLTGTLGFTDDNGDVLGYTVTSAPTRGSVTVSANGKFTYIPDPDKRPVIGDSPVTDSFVITATDPGGATGFVTVTVTVVPTEYVDPNTAPVAGDPAYVYTVDGATGIVRGDLFVTDSDGDPLTYRLGSTLSAAVGTAAVNASTGQWAFRPSPQARFDSWNGVRTGQRLSIVASDGSAEITIHIDAPVLAGFDLQTSTSSGIGAQPGGVAVSEDGHIYVASSGDGTVRVLRPDGSSAPAISVGGTLFGIAVDGSGRLVVSDPGTGAITVVDPSGATPPQRIATVAGAAGVAVDASGRIFVASLSSPTVTVLDSAGEVVDTVELTAAAFGIAAGPGGRIYAAVGNSVVVLDSAGNVERTVQPGLGQLYGIAVDERGTLYLSDVASKLHVLTAEGAVRSVTLGGVSAGIAVTAGGAVATDINGGLTKVVAVAPAEVPAAVTVNPITGVVSGSTDVLNPGGFHHALGSGPGVATGTVVVDPVTGQWRFTPTPGARHQAQNDPSAASVTFTVVVTGGVDPVTVTVTAPIVAAFPDDDRVLDPDDLLALSREGLVEVVQNSDGTVRSIDGTFTTTPVLDAADAAEVFSRIAGLLGYSPGFVGAGDITSFSPETGSGEAAPVYHYLNLTMNGIPVVGRGSGAVLVTDADGVVQGVFSGLAAPDDTVDLEPAAGFETAAAAETIARDALAAYLSEYLDADEVAEALAVVSFRSELVVYYSGPTSAGLLTWRVAASVTPSQETPPGAEDDPVASPPIRTVYIQAAGENAGQIVGQQSILDGLIASQTVEARDMHDIMRSIVVSTDTSGKWFHDPGRGISVYYGPSSLEDIKPEQLPGGKAWYYASNPSKSAVSAMYNVGAVYDYYREQLGFTPRGHVFVTIVPRFSGAAAYASNKVEVPVGGPTSGSMYLVFGYSTESARDIVGHEYTHGLIDYRPGFGRGDGHGLGDSAQAQALEEAFGDILGSLFEARTTIGLEFWMADDRVNCADTKFNCSFRILEDPSLKGGREKFSQFQEPADLSTYDEYRDSTIFGFAAAKMTEDRRTAAISREQWTKVFGHAIYTLAPEPTFSDARNAVVFSAKMLGFNTDQLAAVKKAFDDVEIFSRGGSYTPPAHWQGVVVDGAPIDFGPTGSGMFTRGGNVAVTSAYDQRLDRTRVALIDTALGTQFGPTFTMDGMATVTVLPQGDRVLVSQIGGGTASKFAIVDTWTGRQVGQTVAVDGWIVNSGLVNGDSILVIESANDDSTTQINFLDTYQGQLVGSGTQVAGRVVSREYEVGLHRAAFQTERTINGKQVYEVHMVDTFWGDKVGIPVATPTMSGLFKSPDGSRLLATFTSPADNSLRLMILDTDLGEQVGGWFTVDGFFNGNGDHEVQIRPNGRAVITTTAGNDELGLTTRIAVLDLNTGTVIGRTNLGSGRSLYTTVNGAGTRAVSLRLGSDAEGTDTQYISVVDLNTARQIGTDIAVPGSGQFEVQPLGDNVVLAIGSEAEFRIVAVNTTTGTQRGSTVTLSGWLDESVARAGNRLVAISQSPSGAATAVVVDGLTGRVLRTSALADANTSVSKIVVNADGSRAAITRYDLHSLDYVLEVVDTQSGAIIGTPVRMEGHHSTHSAQFISDGSRIVMSTSGFFESPLAVIDAGTGEELSRLIFATGYGSLRPAQLSADGRRALVITYGLSSQGLPKRAASVVDIATGKQIGRTVELIAATGWEHLDEQGRRATLTSTVYDTATGQAKTETVILDLQTGKRISPFVRT